MSRHSHAHAADEALLERARDLHRRIAVADLHSHALIGADYMGFGVSRPRPPFRSWNPLRNLFDLVDFPRAQEGGVSLLVHVAYVLPRPGGGGYVERTFRQREALARLVEGSGGRAELAESAAEVERIRAAGKVAAMFAVEGGKSLGGRLETLARLRAAGCVYLTLTHFTNNDLSGSATDPRKKGLTGLGREAIAEMNRLGILVDVTHCSLSAKLEALRISRQPVIYSHTGFSRFVAAERMTTPEEIRAVAASGGVVGVLLSPYFLKGRVRDVGPSDVVDVLEHICSLVGAEHAAIGSDFDSGLPPPTGMRDVRDYPRITAEMLRRGWSEETIATIWGGSFLRVLRAVGR
jgi:membrane dipeptidase